MVPFKCRDQRLVLHPSRVIFWEDTESLIISDLHFGKTGHFRVAGIPVPQHVFKDDLQRLFSLVQFFQPSQLIITGDLFHSKENKELELFSRWRADFQWLKIHLVKGNHDILKNSWYEANRITLSDHILNMDPFRFCHDCNEEALLHGEKETYTFSGHIHPGITLNGPGRQSLRFPCFYFSENYSVLPAFSRFTGTYNIEPGKNDVVYAIVNEKLMRV